MTFSIAGRCPTTGSFGIAITTSSIAVGSRCSFARAGVGAVLTQHRTDPRLGPIGIELLATGTSAYDAVAGMVASTPHHGWRQLAAIDRNGRTALFNGSKIYSTHSGSHGRDCVAIGNIIANEGVPTAMTGAFEAAPNEPLAERLVRGLEAGLEAGGEIYAVKSAALLVVREQPFPYIDLRVDYHDAPIAELRRLWELYAPQAEDFVARAVDPESIVPTPGPSKTSA